ncbi:putative phage tail assembly chaperone [Lelliottia nimipressuralis]|uniref:putative phage tail assembly chaperone n=1 Tax=Lelliottia nimipressuralis TaxID=69220 RepID=UPI00289D7CD8|nr:putative phage tail assembly chaperone [Lelliottia nimipressuralis]
MAAIEHDKVIILTIAGEDVLFQPNMVAYNQLQNEAATGKNVAGALRDYLLKVVQPESKPILQALLMRPGLTVQIAGKLNEEYAPEVEITVKR